MKNNMHVVCGITLTGFVLSIILLSTGCENPLVLSPSPANGSKGTVIIHVPSAGMNTRTLLPITSSVRYQFTFTGEGKEPVQVNTGTIELEPGTWTINAKGFVTINGEEYEAMEGAGEVEVKAGEVSTVEIELSAKKSGDDGVFSYDISFSATELALLSARLTITSLQDNTPKADIDLINENGRGSLDLGPGYYLMKIQLTSVYQATGRTEVVHIYSGLETKAEYTFTHEDFAETITLNGTVADPLPGDAEIYVYVYADEEHSDFINSALVINNGWTMAVLASHEKLFLKYIVSDSTGEIAEKTAECVLPETAKNMELNVSFLPEISVFGFESAVNGLTGELTGTIDEENARITISTLNWVENIDKLKASFRAVGTVSVEANPQTSGVTENDFRNELVYTAATWAGTKNYTVDFISPQTTGLPVMKIDTANNQAVTSKDDYVYTNIRIADSNNPANNFSREGYKDRIRGRGNATWGYPKKPYKIKLDKKTDILGMGEDKDWVLLANYCDKSLMRTGIAFAVSETLGFPWTPKAKFVELFMNGEYLGNYQIVEGIKQSETRVDIPQDGFIIERDGYYLGEPVWFFTTMMNHPYTFKNPDTDDLTDEQLNYIKDYLDEFESVLYSDQYNDPDTGYQKYIDIDSFVRWYLFQHIIANLDTNIFLTKADETDSSKLYMGPVWDFEWSMGIGWYDGSRPRPASDYNLSNTGFYYDKLVEDDLFIEKIKVMWNLYKNEARQVVLQYMEDTKSEILRSQKLNFQKWDILNQKISVGGMPLGSFEAEVECDRQFFVNYMLWLDAAINGL